MFILNKKTKTKHGLDCKVINMNPMSRINMKDYLDTISNKRPQGGKYVKQQEERSLAFMVKYNLSTNDFKKLREKIMRNQFKVLA